jgi:hypothetical protein
MLGLAAFVLFVIAAVLCFVGNTTLITIVGVIAAGLACLALSGSTRIPDNYR